MKVSRINLAAALLASATMPTPNHPVNTQGIRALFVAEGIDPDAWLPHGAARLRATGLTVVATLGKSNTTWTIHTLHPEARTQPFRDAAAAAMARRLLATPNKPVPTAQVYEALAAFKRPDLWPHRAAERLRHGYGLDVTLHGRGAAAAWTLSR